MALYSDGYAQTVDTLDFAASTYMRGPNTTAGLGTAVDISSDLNGDGYAEILACGGFNSSNNGRCWVVAGDGSLSLGNSSVSDEDFATVGGQNAEEIGMNRYSVATTDVDGDGQADILLGSTLADSGNGAVYVFFGGTSLSGNYLTQSDEDVLISGDGSLGAQITVGEDIDLDGSNDLLLGAPTAGNLGEGAVYLLSGVLSAGTYTLPDDQAASWFGANAGDEFGTVISGVIDLEGDGQTEFAISAPGNDDQGSNKGMVYVVPTY
ncbi:MAG: FG-GAP repeat protein [Alphaproteobacteria bacterium]|nr:FG-GAP repeat protein [Alphaproteobacteria bacterium]